MKKLAMLLLLLTCSMARAQQYPTANLTASTASCAATSTACLVVNLGSKSPGGATFTLSGTWSATVQFEASGDSGTTWVALNATPSNSTTAATSATGNGTWQANIAAYTLIRARVSAFTSGTVVATIATSAASARSNSGGGGGGAVSSVFTRTGAVVAANADYNNSQFAAGVNLNTGLFEWYQAGTFTSGSLRETTFAIIGTDSTCSFETTAQHTDALAGCAATPASGVTTGWTTGVAGYVQVNDPTQGGLLGNVEGVGLYTSVWCNANNTFCEGEAPQVNGVAGKTGLKLIGSEIGVIPANTSDTGFGQLLSFEGSSSQPTGDNMPASVVQTPSGTGTWTSGYTTQAGSLASTGNLRAFSAGKQATSGATNSYFLAFTANDGAGDVATGFTLNQDHVLTNSSGIPFVNSSYATYLASTAATISPNILVKIDSANTDGVVICTTTDTICSGFNAETSSASPSCSIGLTSCPIITVPGSRIRGILGTGTCAIGQVVIPDTTTNGRVKCTTISPIPPGATVSLAANSSVGTLFDILLGSYVGLPPVTLTLKKGSGGGNYTNSTTSYTVADSTNLCYTVTIPTGWKLSISASGAMGTATAIVAASAALTDNAACSTANAGILVETQAEAGAIAGATGFALNWVITGNAAAHNIALQFKTANASDSASLINSSATLTPTMVFNLTPSN